jgi:hypothetical protein
LQRYALADKLAGLVGELSSGVDGVEEVDAGVGDGDGGYKRKRQGETTILERMEVMHGELSRLEAGLAWVTVLEKVMLLRYVICFIILVIAERVSEKVLSPESQRPSPLAAIPHYEELHNLVDRTQGVIPPGMALMRVILEVREKTWKGLKDVMAKYVIFIELDLC